MEVSAGMPFSEGSGRRTPPCTFLSAKNNFQRGEFHVQHTAIPLHSTNCTSSSASRALELSYVKELGKGQRHVRGGASIALRDNGKDSGYGTSSSGCETEGSRKCVTEFAFVCVNVEAACRGRYGSRVTPPKHTGKQKRNKHKKIHAHTR
jgi:hypothetical protein